MLRIFSLLALAVALASGALADDRRAAPEQPGATWAELKPLIYGDRAIADGAAIIAIDGPFRAHDAGIVPIELSITPPLGRTVERFALIVEENPAPVAAEIEVGPGLGRAVAMSTRIRVDAYSNIRVVAELDDGSLHQNAVYIRASGGCSAPASKDLAAALAAAGEMRMRVFTAEAGHAEAQVMVRHPNLSGFQIDQVSLLPIPAHFVEDLAVYQGDELVFRVTGGISLSEDPSIRFGFTPNGAATMRVRASDTAGGAFESVFPLTTGS